MKTYTFLGELSDRDLLETTTRLAWDERRATTELVAALAEVDARRLYLGEGCSSLFTYCVQVLRLSEHAAYGRIEAARAARRYPAILDALAQGVLTLTSVTLLAPYLTKDNHTTVLASAHCKSKREVEQIVAALRPRPDEPAVVRKLPPARPSAEPPIAAPPSTDAVTMQPASTADVTERRASIPVVGPDRVPTTPPRRPTIQALAPERFRIQFTVSRKTHDKLRRVQDLLRHVVPDGDPAQVFDRALNLLIAHLEKQRAGAADRPRQLRSSPSRTRTVPAAVKRAVWQRDGGRCAYLGTHGRCTETGFLEYHHVVPFARGGAAAVDNIQLRCRAHNQHEAREVFGVGEYLFVRERWTRDALMDGAIG
jgi:hypothetical protein